MLLTFSIVRRSRDHRLSVKIIHSENFNSSFYRQIMQLKELKIFKKIFKKTALFPKFLSFPILNLRYSQKVLTWLLTPSAISSSIVSRLIILPSIKFSWKAFLYSGRPMSSSQEQTHITSRSILTSFWSKLLRAKRSFFWWKGFEIPRHFSASESNDSPFWMFPTYAPKPMPYWKCYALLPVLRGFYCFLGTVKSSLLRKNELFLEKCPF